MTSQVLAQSVVLLRPLILSDAHVLAADAVAAGRKWSSEQRAKAALAGLAADGEHEGAGGGKAEGDETEHGGKAEGDETEHGGKAEGDETEHDGSRLHSKELPKENRRTLRSAPPREAALAKMRMLNDEKRREPAVAAAAEGDTVCAHSGAHR